MNQFVPDWSLGDDDPTKLSYLLPSANQNKTPRLENELLELVWQDGNLITQSQRQHRSPTPATLDEFKLSARPEKDPEYVCDPFGSSCSPIQDDGISAPPWLQYPHPHDQSFEKDLCSELLYEISASTPSITAVDKAIKDVGEGGAKCSGSMTHGVTDFFSTKSSLSFQEESSTLLPSNPSVVHDGLLNFSHFARPVTLKPDIRSLAPRPIERSGGNKNRLPFGESSSKTTAAEASVVVASSQADSHVEQRVGHIDGIGEEEEEEEEDHTRPSRDGANTDTLVTTITSSSGGSKHSHAGQGVTQSVSNQSHKRKERDGEEFECESEEANHKLSDMKKLLSGSSSSRRSRSAEVHNLSERRRRDRINEKMKALQELIPNCNKSDKASMLDEAIEYLKSLQLQLQILWMGGAISPMMYPTVQHYMSHLGMRMGHSPLPSFPPPVHLPGVSPSRHSVFNGFSSNQAPPTLNPVNFTNSTPGSHIPDSFAWYLGMRPPPQAMNVYNSYASKMFPPPSQPAAAVSRGSGGADVVAAEKSQSRNSD